MILGPDETKIREWTDRSGSFKVQAAFISILDNKVQLHKLNGVKIAVPLEKLDQKDLDYLQGVNGNQKLVVQTQIAMPIPKQELKIKVNTDIPHTTVTGTQEYVFNGFDWKAFLIKAGVTSGDSSTYALKFVQQKMDENSLSYLDRDTLRSMGITEGDIIRIRKIQNLPTASAAITHKATANENRAHEKNMQFLQGKTSAQSQIASDEVYARKLQNDETQRSSRVSNTNIGPVSFDGIQKAGNLLAKSNDISYLAPSSSQSFPAPQGRALSNTSTDHDPWTSFGKTNVGSASSFAAPSATVTGFRSSTGSTSSEHNRTSQALVESQRKAEEMQKSLDNAQQQMVLAQALLEQQSKTLKMQKLQSDAAIAHAQETERKALIMQEQAIKLAQQAKANQAQSSVPLRMAIPLIPTPASNTLNRTMTMQNNSQFNPVMSQMQQGTTYAAGQNNFTNPSWTNASNLYLKLAPSQPFGQTQATRSWDSNNSSQIPKNSIFLLIIASDSRSSISSSIYPSSSVSYQNNNDYSSVSHQQHDPAYVNNSLNQREIQSGSGVKNGNTMIISSSIPVQRHNTPASNSSMDSNAIYLQAQMSNTTFANNSHAPTGIFSSNHIGHANGNSGMSTSNSQSNGITSGSGNYNSMGISSNTRMNSSNSSINQQPGNVMNMYNSSSPGNLPSNTSGTNSYSIISAGKQGNGDILSGSSNANQFYSSSAITGQINPGYNTGSQQGYQSVSYNTPSAPYTMSNMNHSAIGGNYNQNGNSLMGMNTSYQNGASLMGAYQNSNSSPNRNSLNLNTNTGNQNMPMGANQNNHQMAHNNIGNQQVMTGFINGVNGVNGGSSASNQNTLLFPSSNINQSQNSNQMAQNQFNNNQNHQGNFR